jgi:hypothetical protein
VDVEIKRRISVPARNKALLTINHLKIFKNVSENNNKQSETFHECHPKSLNLSGGRINTLLASSWVCSRDLDC